MDKSQVTMNIPWSQSREAPVCVSVSRRICEDWATRWQIVCKHTQGFWSFACEVFPVFNNCGWHYSSPLAHPSKFYPIHLVLDQICCLKALPANIEKCYFPRLVILTTTSLLSFYIAASPDLPSLQSTLSTFGSLKPSRLILLFPTRNLYLFYTNTRWKL